MKRIAIIGNGPSGSALGTFLREKGMEVTLFTNERRPDLIVGESLIPAIIPVLRRLGVEERVAEIGVYKPGVSFVMSPDEKIDFCFQPVAACHLPTYSYNVPRPGFDRVIEERAIEAGVTRVVHQARIESDGPDRVRLAPETLAAAPSLGGRQPDFIVDASGRSRMFARALGIPAKLGSRKDVAHFAHFEGFAPEEPRGQVLIGRMNAGWCWRIPLRGWISVGIVMNKDEIARLGATPEERLEAAIRNDPALAAAAGNARRVTDVATYSNYQLVSERGHGANWAMVGDAFGFVDPMLSPGMWLALHSAEILADNLTRPAVYAAKMNELLGAWMELIELYYDGRMFAMYHTGVKLEQRWNMWLSRFMHRHVETHIACMASGATTSSAYGRGVIRFLSKHFVGTEDLAGLSIR
jgi:flavin-dependent dehydrogenase